MSNKLKHQDNILIILAVTVLLYTYYSNVSKQQRVLETYSDDNIDYIQMEGIENVKENDLSRIEDISDISAGLVVYLSSLDNKSYSGAGKNWYNIAPEMNKNNKIFTFENPPRFDKATGLAIADNSITGPFSMNCGIDINESFTIFINTKIKAESTLEKFVIYESYAVNDNVGVYLHIINTPAVSSMVDGLAVTKPANSYIQIETGFSPTQAYQLSTSRTIYDDYHLITVVKDIEHLNVYLDKNLTPIITISNLTKNSNKFSNKNVQLFTNPGVMTQTYVKNFGIYNKALSVAELGSLYDHIQSQITKQSETYKKIEADLQTLQNQLFASKENPFTSTDITQSCSMVKDWSTLDKILDVADESCLRSIYDYCKTDSNLPHCQVFKKLDKIVPIFAPKNSATTVPSPPLLDVDLSQNINADTPNYGPDDANTYIPVETSLPNVMKADNANTLQLTPITLDNNSAKVSNITGVNLYPDTNVHLGASANTGVVSGISSFFKNLFGKS